MTPRRQELEAATRREVPFEEPVLAAGNLLSTIDRDAHLAQETVDRQDGRPLNATTRDVEQARVSQACQLEHEVQQVPRLDVRARRRIEVELESERARANRPVGRSGIEVRN